MTDPTMIEVSQLQGEDLRRFVNGWVRENLPEDWWAGIEDGDADRVTAARELVDRSEWLERAGRAGLLFPTWPREYHGLDMSPEQAKVISEELARYQTFRNMDFAGQFLLGPVLMQWGTEEQRQRYLPRVALGKDEWCQLFSEPGAGSDLAGLATRAVRDGDSWIVNGQKVWTSGGLTADYGLLIARSDPDAPKHQGITYFLADMHADGVETRPLIQITGETTFAEVFLTDVLIPDDHRVGPVNEGWRVSTTTLANERSSLSGAPKVGRGMVDDLVEAAERLGRWHEASVRQELMRMLSQERALQMTNLRTFALNRAGKAPGAEGSITKLAQSRLMQRMSRFSADLHGADATAWLEGDGEATMRNYSFLHSSAITILGGTSEIQRNIIGERVLGLPKEPGLPSDTPWKDIPRSS